MISVELTRFFKAVEGGLELEASKYKCSIKSREKRRKILLRFLLLRVQSSRHQQGCVTWESVRNAEFPAPSQAYRIRICILTISLVT